MRLLIIFFLSCCFSLQSSAAETVRVGVIVPLSGSVAIVGSDIRRSVELAAAAQPSGGTTVSFIFEDNEFVPKNTVTAAKKLVEQDGVAAMIVFGSSTSLAVVDYLEKKQIPLIAIGISDIGEKAKRYILRISAPAQEIGKTILAEAERRNYKSVALVTTSQDGMLEMKRQFDPRGMKVVLDEEVLPAETDLRALATKIARLNPDFIMASLLHPHPAVFARQLREQQYRGQIIGGPPFGDFSQIAAAEGALEGALFVTGSHLHAGAFFAEFKNKWGHKPVIEACYARDAADLIIAGAGRGNINEYLHSVRNFTGIFGTYGVKDNAFQVPVILNLISGAGYEAYKP